MTKWQRWATALMFLNLTGLVYVWSELRPAAAQDIPQVMRAHGLEIVDSQGRVRAELKVFPSEPNYPGTVLLRLISSHGAPNVKLSTMEDGSGLALGNGDGAYMQALSRRPNPFIKFVNKDGRELTLEAKP